jgi:hypothetical protein
VYERAKKFPIRQLLQISSSRSYETPNKLFVVSGDMGIQQIIHGQGGGGGIWVPNQILKIQFSGRLRVGTVNFGFVSRKNIKNIQEI